MQHNLVIFAGMAIAIGFVWLGIKINGVAGGILGFIIGVILTGFIATSSGIDLAEQSGCTRYSSFADDC